MLKNPQNKFFQSKLCEKKMGSYVMTNKLEQLKLLHHKIYYCFQFCNVFLFFYSKAFFVENNHSRKYVDARGKTKLTKNLKGSTSLQTSSLFLLHSISIMIGYKRQWEQILSYIGFVCNLIQQQIILSSRLINCCHWQRRMQYRLEVVRL